MTATAPRWRGPSTPVGGPLREYRLYRFYGHDGTLLYIGITGRMPLVRLVEHLMDKSWAPEIARWEVDPRVWASEAEVLAAEEAAIRAERPRYNWQHNEGNPNRVWSPPTRREGGPRPAGQHPAVVVLSSRFTWWTLAYLAAVVGSWWLVAQVPWPLSGRWHLGVAAALPVVVALGVWRWWALVGRRRWRRLRRLVP